VLVVSEVSAEGYSAQVQVEREVGEAKKGRWRMSQSQFKGPMVDVRCSVKVATIFAELFGQLLPVHAEAVTQFCTRIQQSCRELGDIIYNKNPQERHDGTDAP
jgi:hypothetical protein